jgi:choline dehydrogenase-like flavoprotein
MGGQIATGGGRGRAGGRGTQAAAASGQPGARGGGQAPQTGQAGPQTGQPTAPAGQPTTMGQPAQAAAVPISRGGAIIHEVDEVGTVRMGDDPKTSPLNRFCQGHEVKNLFVADGAVFVSNPDKNPTHSIVALAWRTAEYLAEEMRKGNV